MIEYRHEAAMAIAVINKTSKIAFSAIQLDDIPKLRSVFEENVRFWGMAEDIIDYVSRDTDALLYNQLVCLIDPQPLREYARKLKKETLLSLALMDLSDSIDMLHQYGNQLDADNRLHPTLNAHLADAETIELLDRAVRDGLLTRDYQPKTTTKVYQLKLIAMAIISIRGFKTRNRWCHFDDQWELGNKHLAKTVIPLSKGAAIYRISNLYPEADFHAMLSKPAEGKKLLRTHFTEQGVAVLCKQLKAGGFLDARTCEETFQAVTGFGSGIPCPLNWTGSFDSLVYFAKEAFGDLNPKVLTLAAQWFLLHKKPVNHGTMKTKSSKINRAPDKYGFIPIIDSYIKRALEIR